MPRGILLTANLPQLQNLIKRDPAGYKEEFLQQWNHYNSIRQIFHLESCRNTQHNSENSYGSLYPDTRKALIQTLVLLRNKGVTTSIDLLKCLFPLLPRTTSPALRSLIRKTILTDIRTANMKSKNHKLNRSIQAMMFGMVERGLEDQNFGDKGKAKELASDNKATGGDDAMWAVILTKELWRKGIWNDAKPVSIVALGCLHPIVKVQSASMHFFLSSTDDQEDSDDEEEEVDVKALHHRREINKKTRSGDKRLQKKLNVAKKKKHGNKDSSNPNFPALQLLNDPQTFAEKLFDILSRYDKRFSLDHKVLMMQLVSRVMGAHKLCVLSFYTYILKYLTHHQLRVPGYPWYL
ncbi:hypothetical protein MPER_06750 [Moniliophthora perniciosa FA553]|nr:hypothetical protein MPER_06750 [Moniliophthora perniciosa FA553]